ncbi:MAG: hypothetical protein AB1585_14470 [Thermodesulfobacteriota bacterium]
MIRPFPPLRLYLLLIFSADLGLLIQPLRFLSAMILVGLLPGYLVVQRLKIWKDPFFATVGSLGISLLVSPLIVLPGCILFRQVNSWIIAVSLNLFFFMMLCRRKGRERVYYYEREHPLWLPLLMILICGWVMVYLDITGLGPYCTDWTYLFGIVKELSRNMPPLDPEASFLPLRYQWGFWFFYAILHRLGDLSVWKVFEWASVYSSFIFMGLVYMVLFQATKNRAAGFWAIVLFAVGRHSEWIIRGFQGLGWVPGYYDHMSYEYVQAITGYSLLWGWYSLPGLIPPLAAFYFLIRHFQEHRRKDLWLSLGATSISPFFHPIYYFGFLGGLSILLVFLLIKKEFRIRLLLFYLTFIPFSLTFFLFLRPHLPEDPLYRFFLEKAALIKLFWFYLFFDGIAMPFGLLAAVVSPAARRWFLPFSLLFALLCLFGGGLVNHAAHFALQNSLYLTLLSAIGLAYLKKINPWIRTTVYGLVLIIILPPFIQEVSSRIRTGWEGIVEQEQRTVGAFIRNTTDPNSAFVSLPESTLALTTIIGLGERKVILGYHYHLDRYESKASIKKWDREIKHFFKTTDRQWRIDFLKRYKIHYVFLGPEERDLLTTNGQNIETFKKDFIAVFKHENIEVLKTDL